MANKHFFSLPTKKETVICLSLTIIFLILTATFVGLRPEHGLLTGLFCLLFFLSSPTRKLAMALLPFAIFGASYDWMRVYPNYEVNPVDVEGLYQAEKQLFGIVSATGVLQIPGEWFSDHTHPLADILAGIFYLCWVPVPIAFGLYLYFKGDKKYALHFSLSFLLVNLIGFAIYYIHPAAPPWYAINYGMEVIKDTPGNTAGLGRFDEMIGLPIFHSIYGRNANIFAAVPSLHAAYMLIATIYAVLSKQSKILVILFAIITMGIWWTAVYSTHHYIIDVLLGIGVALFGILLFEQVLMRIPAFARFMHSYERYI